MMVQDPLFARYENLKPTEGFHITQEDFYLDGPVTKRVAVLDFDSETSLLLPGVPLRPPRPRRVPGRYDIVIMNGLCASDFGQKALTI
jgi:hypothetical protein